MLRIGTREWTAPCPIQQTCKKAEVVFNRPLFFSKLFSCAAHLRENDVWDKELIVVSILQWAQPWVDANRDLAIVQRGQMSLKVSLYILRLTRSWYTESPFCFVQRYLPRGTTILCGKREKEKWDRRQRKKIFTDCYYITSRYLLKNEILLPRYQI